MSRVNEALINAASTIVQLEQTEDSAFSLSGIHQYLSLFSRYGRLLTNCHLFFALAALTVKPLRWGGGVFFPLNFNERTLKELSSGLFVHRPMRLPLKPAVKKGYASLTMPKRKRTFGRRRRSTMQHKLNPEQGKPADIILVFSSVSAVLYMVNLC